MIRRRALLAASAASGGGGGNESFYAEFFFDYCEESPLYKYCYRAPDALSLECYEVGKALVEKYGVTDDVITSISVLVNPIDYGFEVYIEGVLCTELSIEYGSLHFKMKTEYLGFLTNDGTLSHEV